MSNYTNHQQPRRGAYTSIDNYDYLLKTLVVGDSGVGKSCLLKRLTEDIFVMDSLPTIGVDFEIYTFNIDEKIVKMQIWDTAGQERFSAIVSSYYRGAHLVMIVFDVTELESFNNITKWMNDIKKYSDKDVKITLVGNKIDLNLNRVISYDQAKEFADKNRLSYIETSSKTNINVEESFYDSAQQTLNSQISKKLEIGPKAKLNMKQSQNINYYQQCCVWF